GVAAFQPRLLAEARIARTHAFAQLLLLRIEPADGKAALHAAHAKALIVQRRDRAHPQVRDLATLVRQRDERVVVHPRTRAPRDHLAVHGLRRTEQLDRLVHQVRAQVEQHAAALRRVAALAPALLDLGAEA